MEIRPARPGDLPAIRELYRRARAYMAAGGNPDQWGENWPDEARIKRDIELGQSWLCTQGERPLAVFVYLPGPEPTYAHIEGAWPDDEAYGVVHRLAAAGERTGAGEYCLKWCRGRCRQLRIDTHEKNLPMRSLLAKLGFRPCGVICVEDGSSRLAYYLD